MSGRRSVSEFTTINKSPEPPEASAPIDPLAFPWQSISLVVTRASIGKGQFTNKTVSKAHPSESFIENVNDPSPSWQTKSVQHSFAPPTEATSEPTGSNTDISRSPEPPDAPGAKRHTVASPSPKQSLSETSSNSARIGPGAVTAKEVVSIHVNSSMMTIE